MPLKKGVPSTEERIRRLNQLFALCKPVPADWLNTGGKAGSVRLEPLACESWRELLMAWRRALHWGPELERTLAVMLACCLSTRLLGDQLWIKVVSPPSTGKSVLCEALAVARDYVLPKSTLRGFYSGYRDDKEATEDHSLIAQLHNKTLVVKDGDSLLTAPNKDQILGEARDLYDTTGRSSYRIKAVSREYEGVRFSWVLCGTESLRVLDSSELGERFLDCVIVDRIDDDWEDEVGLRKVNQVRYHRAEADGRVENLDAKEMVKAKRLTGGYVCYLRRNALRLYEAVDMDDATARYITRLGKFVAHMRSRPSKKQEEGITREMSTRLISQLARLALCLGVVTGSGTVDTQVKGWVRQTALDTARGLTLDMIKAVYNAGERGLTLSALCAATHLGNARGNLLTGFLRRLEVLQLVDETVAAAKGQYGQGATVVRRKWLLTDRMQRLYNEVMQNLER